MNFAYHVMGMPFCSGILQDRRLQGRAKRLQGVKPVVRQQIALTVEAVAKLEKLVAGETLCDVDTYVLGGLVFCLYSRSRWSDLKMLLCIWVDFDSDDQVSGFVEARTRDHKTNNTAKTKRRAMPLVAPFPGVTDANWVKAWLSAGRRLGVIWDAEPFGPLVRAPDANGKLCAQVHLRRSRGYAMLQCIGAGRSGAADLTCFQGHDAGMGRQAWLWGAGWLAPWPPRAWFGIVGMLQQGAVECAPEGVPAHAWRDQSEHVQA